MEMDPILKSKLYKMKFFLKVKQKSIMKLSLKQNTAHPKGNQTIYFHNQNFGTEMMKTKPRLKSKSRQK
jgi:hypothetical protein